MRRALALLPLALPLALACCGGGGARRPLLSAGAGNYAAPGPAGDPWGPYIHEASARYDVPERWIREVIHQESGGHQYLHGQAITSDAGAMGLMQIMPATYDELRTRYGLGPDPYDPHDNILAGTAYIHELYEKYGAPAFLAAYNAGPLRLEGYLATGASLPNETVNYLASVAPRLDTDRPLSGPLAAYADDGGLPPQAAPVPKAYASSARPGCWHDPNAAYDPDAPCQPPPVPTAAPLPIPAPPVQLAAADPARQMAWGGAVTPVYSAIGNPARQPAPLPAPAPAPVPQTACWHDPDAAYDPAAPCQTPPAPAAPPPVQVAEAPLPPLPAAPVPVRRPMLVASAPPRPHPRFALIASANAAETSRPLITHGVWSIQVGAFASPDLARNTADTTRRLVPILASTRPVVGTTSPFGGHVLYRARLAGLSQSDAAEACRELTTSHTPCLIVPP